VVRLCASAKQRGYGYIKLHERNETAVASVARAREAVGGDIGLMLDTNCAWLADQVMDKARALLPYGLKWLEEPVYPPDDFATLARVRATTGMPVAAGENLGTVQEFGRMIDAGAVDYIQPDVGKFGGICEMMKAAAIAEARGVPLMPHSPLFGPVLIATLHVVAAIKTESLCEYYYCDLAESPVGHWAIPQEGYFLIPDGPGLGVEVDEDVVARYRLP
jgi:L-alanine-DL-glutamate epimerase-like enolase superfamily enzyme